MNTWTEPLNMINYISWNEEEKPIKISLNINPKSIIEVERYILKDYWKIRLGKIDE